MSGFYNNVDYINSLADNAAGFIWRETEEDIETLERLWGDNYLYTLSTWDDVASLRNFLYQSAHLEMMKSGRKWFHKLQHARLVLWWVPVNHMPTLQEAHERLIYLYEKGPSYHAFDLKSSDLPIVLF